MREFWNKLVAGIYMIVVFVMVWLPIHCYYSDVHIPGMIKRHTVAANLIWYGAAILLSCIPASHLKKDRYINWALSIGFTLIGIGLVFCNFNF